MTLRTQYMTVSRFASIKTTASHVHAKMDIDCWQTTKTAQVGGVSFVPCESIHVIYSWLRIIVYVSGL